MKIYYWTPYMGNVGTIKATINSAISLKELGNQAKIYKAYREWEGYEDLIKKRNIDIIDLGLSRKISSLPKYHAGFRVSMLIISIHSFFKLLKNYNEDKPDVVVANLLGFLPLLVKRFSKHKPIVINSIQGLPRFNSIRKVLWNLLYKKSDLIITLTEETKKDLMNKFNFDKSKIFVVPNPIISRDIDDLKNELVEEGLFEKDTMRIIGVGRLTKQKDFETLIKAFEIVERQIICKLIILGEGEEREKLEALIREKGLENKVYLVGFVKNPYKYLNKSDLFVLSSLWEDQGHALIEAAYLRKPIVCTKCPRGQEEFLDYGESGTLCEMRNEKDMANKIISVLENIESDSIKNKIESAYNNSQKFLLVNHGINLREKIINLRY